MPDHNTVSDAPHAPMSAALDLRSVAAEVEVAPEAVAAEVAPDAVAAEVAPHSTDAAPAPGIDDAARDALFGRARTHYAWTGQGVSDDELRAVFDTMRMAPTSANSSPARFLFLRTPEAKARLRPALSPGNVDKTLAAPVVTIVAYDPHFYDHLPRLFPHADARSWFSGNPDLAADTAIRNGTLQGAYFLLAARAHGLDCGPMSGFDNARVDEVFLADRGWKSNFLINLGHGDHGAVPPRSPRFSFDEICLLL